MGLAVITIGFAPASAEEDDPAGAVVTEEPTTEPSTPSAEPGEPEPEAAPAEPDPVSPDGSNHADDDAGVPTSEESTADEPLAEEPVDILSQEAVEGSGESQPVAALPAQTEDELPAEVVAAVEGDMDNDTIPDSTDNCDTTYNVLQGDRDLDLLGNACDPDFGEQDGVGGNIYENRLCQAITLVPNDDSSSPESQKIFFPTPLNFFGVEQRSAYVNNNGNITFVNPLSTFTPFAITASTPPIIAPFLGDVDTRGSGGVIGGKVTYGVALNSPAFGGRNVTCITWEHVGYFSSHLDKRDTFQLLIVERSDIALGDFDIYFNYAGLQWETGDASGGTNGLGGTSAGAGFSSGTGIPAAFFSMPCSLINGACLDTNNVTGLRNTSTNSPIRGRHIFRVRGGGETFAGSVQGTVRLNDPPQITQPLVNALVELCQALPTGSFGNCRSTFTVATGAYDIRNLPPGNYRLRVFPQRIGGRNSNPSRIPNAFVPSGVGVDPLPIEVQVLNLGNGETRVVDLETSSGTPPPNGVTLGTNRNGSHFPHLVAGRPTTFRVAAPCGVNGTFEIFQNGRPVAAGTLLPVGGGIYQATVTITTTGPIDVRVVFPGCTSFRFDGYVDPSGLVVDQNGVPIPGARVVLLRSEFPEGPFEQVPSGSEIMSPSNRDNPDVTDAQGFFGWDVLSGFYRVDASAPDCADGSTGVLPVPPEQVDLRIVLACVRAAAQTPTTAATTTTTTGTVLAVTGSDTRGLAILGVTFLVTGVLLLASTRRVQPRRVHVSRKR